MLLYVEDEVTSKGTAPRAAAGGAAAVGRGGVESVLIELG